MVHAQAQDQAGQAQQQQPGAAAQQVPAQPGATQSPDQSGAAQQTGDRTSAAQPAESEIRQTLAQTDQMVLDKDQAKNLAQLFCQKDQDRIKDFDAQQVSASVDQIRQAYKDKYQQDLDLTKNADQVFNSQFFRIGPGEARTASERIGADATSAAGAARSGADAAAQKDAAGVGAAARQGGAAVSDAAQAAASGAGPMITVDIPASGDQPATKLNLVKEGSSWKIDLPDRVDGKQLAQRLNDHLQMAVQQKDKWPADASEGARAISRHVFMAFGSEGSGASGAAPGAAPGAGAGTSGTDATATPGQNSGQNSGQSR
jgi:hypothetical protein